MLIGHYHQDINDAYRAGNRSVEQNPVVRVAASVMNKLPDFQGMIHRGLSFHSVDELEASPQPVPAGQFRTGTRVHALGQGAERRGRSP